MKMEQTMQDIFKRLINEIFLVKFKPYGWKRQGSNFRYIDESGLGRVINFQKSKWNTADDLEFFINYGLYIEVDNQLVNKCVFRLNGTACTLQREGCPLQTGSFLSYTGLRMFLPFSSRRNAL